MFGKLFDYCSSGLYVYELKKYVSCGHTYILSHGRGCASWPVCLVEEVKEWDGAGWGSSWYGSAGWSWGEAGAEPAASSRRASSREPIMSDEVLEFKLEEKGPPWGSGWSVLCASVEAFLGPLKVLLAMSKSNNSFIQI